MFFKKKIILLLVCASFVNYGNLATASEAHIGGQIRLRGDFVKNQNLGDFSFSPDIDDEQLVSRSRLNASISPREDVHVIGELLRIEYVIASDRRERSNLKKEIASSSSASGGLLAMTRLCYISPYPLLTRRLL